MTAEKRPPAKVLRSRATIDMRVSPLDRRLFVLEGQQYAAFLRTLDGSPLPGERLRRLMASRSPWET